MSEGAWAQIEREAMNCWRGAGRFPLRAYSENMPPPYVGLKPYAPSRAASAATALAIHDDALDITEAEQAHELEAGFERIGAHVVHELSQLLRGAHHTLSRTLLTDNPAWPASLAEAAAKGALADDPVVLLLSVALSRTQDEFGNVRWTLFGASHEGPAAPFWGSFPSRSESARERFDEVIAWTGASARVRILEGERDLPRALAPLVLPREAPLDGVDTLVTFQPFGTLPAHVQAAYLARTLTLLPCPASLVFFHHARYAALASALPQATQIPLLHLFPRVEQSCTIRIPQSGWLDEQDGHRVVAEVRRAHRWERVERDQRSGKAEGKFADKVSVALFSTRAEDLELYGKPMAKNAQVWTTDYALLLDGPRADRDAIARAAKDAVSGGRFGYRFYYPPMRAGARELYWHRPIVARRLPGSEPHEGRRAAGTEAEVHPRGPSGYVTAEHANLPPLVLSPRLLARPGYEEAARLYAFEPGLARYTTSHNARKLLEMRELLDAPLSPSFARALVRTSKTTSLEAWLAHLPDAASDRVGGARLTAALRHVIGEAEDLGAPITLAGTESRAFEERVWRSIAELSEGDLTQKENADAIADNRGRTGGPAAKAAHVHANGARDLEAVGELFHAKYRAMFERHGMSGVAEVVDHVFRWETDFDFSWMGGWAKNQKGPAERNVVCVIPGRNRKEAVIMGDHYDTAYMEDVFEKERGGDGLRAAAAGADDNASATTALFEAAEALLPLAKAGMLERDVWLVHLTGEEFPADSLGARALAQGLVEGTLAFTSEDGRTRDVSDVRVVGAYVLDMVGHNHDHDRDVFQIAPGEGAASARLALAAHRANERWNRLATEWNRGPERAGRGRAQRMPDGKTPPPPFAHLPLSGEVRVEWEPRSALYNTDGQAFSDVGIPVVLFMENYDINRTGYHDTHDTMANIDLDYCAAMIAIAIESVAEIACAKSA